MSSLQGLSSREVVSLQPGKHCAGKHTNNAWLLRHSRDDAPDLGKVTSRMTKQKDRSHSVKKKVGQKSG